MARSFQLREPTEPRRRALCFTFDTAIGRRYHLEVRDDLNAGAWTPTADMFQATSNGTRSFDKTISGSPRFYRVLVE